MSIFASTPSVNLDPAPYLYENGDRSSIREYVNDYSPRDEFELDQIRAHRANPILVSYRFEVEELGHAYPEDWLPVTEHGYLPNVTDDERDHARRVLERLARLAQIEEV